MKKQLLDLIGIEYIDDEPKEKYKSYTHVMNGVSVGLIFAGAVFFFIGMLGLLINCYGDNYSRLKYCVELCTGTIIFFLGQLSSIATEVYDRQELLIKMVESSQGDVGKSLEGSFDKLSFETPVSDKENEIMHIFWDKAKPNIVIYQVAREKRGVQELDSSSTGINESPIAGDNYFAACKKLCGLLKDAINEKDLFSQEELQAMEKEWIKESQ